MVDVPRHDQEAHLRAIIPEWLTRPPEVEVLRRQQLADQASEDTRIRGLARRERTDTVRSVVVFTVLVQLAFGGLAAVPLLGALVLGALLGTLMHLVGEGVFIWVVASALMGWSAALWSGGLAITYVVAPCAAGLVGAVVGVVRDPLFRI